jgi:hypothetical protein
MELRTVELGDLAIDDERSVGHVAIYARLKQALARSRHRFHVPPAHLHLPPNLLHRLLNVAVANHGLLLVEAPAPCRR